MYLIIHEELQAAAQDPHVLEHKKEAAGKLHEIYCFVALCHIRHPDFATSTGNVKMPAVLYKRHKEEEP